MLVTSTNSATFLRAIKASAPRSCTLNIHSDDTPSVSTDVNITQARITSSELRRN